MSLKLNDEELKSKAWQVLGEHLGSVDAMRFLMLVREGPRDYQGWRDEYFKGMSVAEIAQRIRSGADSPGVGSETGS